MSFFCEWYIETWLYNPSALRDKQRVTGLGESFISPPGWVLRLLARMLHGTCQQGQRVPSRWHGRSCGWPQMSRGQWVPQVLDLKSSEQELEYDPTCQVFHTWTLPPQICPHCVHSSDSKGVGPLYISALLKTAFSSFSSFQYHKSFLCFFLKLIYRQKALPIWKFPSDAWIFLMVWSNRH